MAERRCEDCQQRMLPYVPRKTRVDGAKVCWACAERPRGGYVSAASNEPEPALPRRENCKICTAPLDGKNNELCRTCEQRHVDSQFKQAAKGDSTDLWHPGDLYRHLKEDHRMHEAEIPTHLSMMQLLHNQDHEPDQVQTKDSIVGAGSQHQHAPSSLLTHSTLSPAEVDISYQYHSAGKLAAHGLTQAAHSLVARTTTGETGHVVWDAATSEIQDIFVTEGARRQGLATLLLDHAKSLGHELKHSAIRSRMGDAWGKAVGIEMPEWTGLSPREAYHDHHQPSSESTDMSDLRKIAHDSGDGETIYHCPFCGSGQVLARSDKTVECEFCFAGETEFISVEGVKTFNDTVGTIQRILVSTAAINGKNYTENGGKWMDAEIRDFGVQPLMKVTLKRFSEIKEIYATAEHRWLVTPMTNQGFRSGRRNVVVTRGLQSRDRLAPLVPVSRITAGHRETVPSPFGIAHGFVFGDGTLDGRKGSFVTLWGEKDKALLPYFAASEQKPVSNANDTKGIEIRHLPAYFKGRVPLTESLSYLYGWLAGYFAADGSVNESGTAELYCVKKEELAFVRDVCTVLGIATSSIRTYSRKGFGDEYQDMHRCTIVSGTLTEDFFIVPEHRERYMAKVARRAGSNRKPEEHLGWRVVSVEETDRVENVYCAVVPGFENFTLADNINVMNCHVSFTVQVQPEMSAFPQTINGLPVDVPGMPGEIGSEGGDPMDPNALPGDETDAPGDGGPDSEESPVGEKDDSSDSKNPFGKSSFRTASGAYLNLEWYLRHLAYQANHPLAPEDL